MNQTKRRGFTKSCPSDLQDLRLDSTCFLLTFVLISGVSEFGWAACTQQRITYEQISTAFKIQHETAKFVIDHVTPVDQRVIAIYYIIISPIFCAYKNFCFALGWRKKRTI